MITSEDSVWIYKDFCLWWGLVDIKVGAFGNEIKADYSDDDDDDDGGDNDNNDDDKGNDDDDYADENSDGYDDDDSDDNDHLAALYMSHLLLLGKFKYGGGPIFKVVLEC